MNEAEDRVEYAEQNTLLRKQFDPVMTEPIGVLPRNTMP